jgi:hypothetical protein
MRLFHFKLIDFEEKKGGLTITEFYWLVIGGLFVQ